MISSILWLGGASRYKMQSLDKLDRRLVFLPTAGCDLGDHHQQHLLHQR